MLIVLLRLSLATLTVKHNCNMSTLSCGLVVLRFPPVAFIPHRALSRPLDAVSLSDTAFLTPLSTLFPVVQSSAAAGPTLAGLPVWPQIFYCIRCGGRGDAADLALAAGNGGDCNDQGEMFDSRYSARSVAAVLIVYVRTHIRAVTSFLVSAHVVHKKFGRTESRVFAFRVSR